MGKLNDKGEIIFSMAAETKVEFAVVEKKPSKL